MSSSLAIFICRAARASLDSILEVCQSCLSGSAKSASQVIPGTGTSFATAVNSKAFQDIAKSKYFSVDIRSGEAADKRAAQLEAITAATFTRYADQIGAVVKSPADLGLPEPEGFEAWWPPEGYTPVAG